MAFVGAGLVVALWALTRRLGASTPAAILVGAGAVAGTYTLPYVKEFFSEPLTALCLVAAIERVLAGRAGTAGFALGLGVLVRPQCVLVAPLLALAAWQRDGVRAALRTALAAVPGVAVTLAYNVARFGHPLQFGYEDVGFTTPFLNGATGLLFHPAKSLLLFAPVSVLLPFAAWRLWRVDRWAAVVIVGNFAITFTTVAMWFAWHGGWSWGPRLLIPALLPLVAAVGPWLERRVRWGAAVLLFAVGLVVSFPALIVSTQTQQIDEPPISLEELWKGHYMATQPLRSPQPLRQAQLVLPVARYSLEHAFERPTDGRNYLRYLSLWQLGATRVMGRAGLLFAVTLTGLLLSCVLFAARRVAATARTLIALESALKGSRGPQGPAPRDLSPEATTPLRAPTAADGPR
jgi:hypothetical protein